MTDHEMSVDRRLADIERTQRLLLQIELPRQRRRARSGLPPTAQIAAAKLCRRIELELDR